MVFVVDILLPWYKLFELRCKQWSTSLTSLLALLLLILGRLLLRLVYSLLSFPAQIFSADKTNWLERSETLNAVA